MGGEAVTDEQILDLLQQLADLLQTGDEIRFTKTKSGGVLFRAGGAYYQVGADIRDAVIQAFEGFDIDQTAA